MLMWIIALFILNSAHIKATKTSQFSIKSGSDKHARFDREVLLTDENTEEDVLNLPPEIQKERLKKLVKKGIDTNHDGYVDRSELYEWTLKSFNSFETEETRHEFVQVDANENGGVTWEEHVTATYGKDFDEEDLFDSDDMNKFLMSHELNKRLFHAADQDNNTMLNQFEYVAFKHPRFLEATKKIFVESVLNDTDLNRDGKIDLEEFLAENGKTQGDNPDWEIVETDKFQEELDSNRDGFLVGNEIMNWMASNNIEESQEETDHIISECDTNGDSKLSVDEILSNKELWLESDVTDYGQWLARHDEL